MGHIPHHLASKKCFVINLMKKAGYIYRGNLYLSLISCQYVRQMSAIARLWLWKYSVTDGFLIPFCQQLTMWFILKDHAASIVWGVAYSLNFVWRGGGGGALQLATQVSCPMFRCMFTRFRGFISNSRYDSGFMVVWKGWWVQSCFCHIFRRKAVSAHLCAVYRKKADLKNDLC